LILFFARTSAGHRRLRCVRKELRPRASSGRRACYAASARREPTARAHPEGQHVKIVESAVAGHGLPVSSCLRRPVRGERREFARPACLATRRLRRRRSIADGCAAVVSDPRARVARVTPSPAAREQASRRTATAVLAPGRRRRGRGSASRPATRSSSDTRCDVVGEWGYGAWARPPDAAPAGVPRSRGSAGPRSSPTWRRDLLVPTRSALVQVATSMR